MRTPTCRRGGISDKSSGDTPMHKFTWTRTSINKQCRWLCLGPTHRHRSAMRGQLESLHNHWDLAWPQLPWGTTDASDRTKPQQYCKVSTCEGCSFNLPFTHPVCASVKELGTDLHTWHLEEKKNNQAGPVGRQTTTVSPSCKQDPGIPSVWHRWIARLYMPVGRQSWFK